MTIQATCPHCQKRQTMLAELVRDIFEVVCPSCDGTVAMLIDAHDRAVALAISREEKCPQRPDRG